MVSRGQIPRSNCPISNSLDIVGDRWTLVVLRDLLLGGKNSFAELAAPECIPTNTLTERLDRLEKKGVIERRRDPSDARRCIYVPTEKGIALIPVLIDLAVWGIERGLGTSHAYLAEEARKDRQALVDQAIEQARKATTR